MNMENIENKIYALMRKSSHMRKIYQKYPQLKDEELLIELEAQSKIEEKILETPILKESLFGFGTFFDLKPSDILEKIEYKSDTEIRMDFEKMKREIGISNGRKSFGTEKGGLFKTGTPDSDTGSNFSNGPHSFNI